MTGSCLLRFTPSCLSVLKHMLSKNGYCQYLNLPFEFIFSVTLEYIMTLHVKFTKNPAIKKWISFKFICAVYLKYIWTITIPKFSVLICSVQQEPSSQQVASIWSYMCSIHRVHSNHYLCLTVPTFTDPICSVQQEPSHQKVASIWAYMYSILEYIVTINSVRLYPNLLTLYVQCTKKQAIKRWFHLSLYVQYT